MMISRLIGVTAAALWQPRHSPKFRRSSRRPPGPGRSIKSYPAAQAPATPQPRAIRRLRPRPPHQDLPGRPRPRPLRPRLTRPPRPRPPTKTDPAAQAPAAPTKTYPAAQAPAAPTKTYPAAQAPAAPTKTYPAGPGPGGSDQDLSGRPGSGCSGQDLPGRPGSGCSDQDLSAAQAPAAPAKSYPAAQAPAAPAKTYPAAQMPAAPAKTYPAAQIRLLPPRPTRPHRSGCSGQDLSGRSGGLAGCSGEDLSGFAEACGTWQGDHDHTGHACSGCTSCCGRGPSCSSRSGCPDSSRSSDDWQEGLILISDQINLFIPGPCRVGDFLLTPRPPSCSNDLSDDPSVLVPWCKSRTSPGNRRGQILLNDFPSSATAR